MQTSKNELTKSLRRDKQKQSFVKFKENSMNGIIRVGSALGNNRFLVAIRDAFMLPFAFTTGAAIPLILSNLFFARNSVLTGLFPSIKNTEGMIWVDKLIGVPLADVFWAVMAGFSIYLCVGIGYFLAKSYGKDGIIAGALCVAIFFTLKPLEGVNQWVVGSDAGATRFSTNYLSSNGMLIALLGSLLATYLYCKLMDVKWLIPKLPESVPPMVAKSFGAIFVSAIVLTLFSFLNAFWFVIATEANIRGNVVVSELDESTGMITSTTYARQLSTLFIALEFIMAKPLMGLSSNIWATVVISFMVAFFWFFGIHGTNIMAPVTSIVWDANVLRNTAYYATWKNLNAENPDAYHNYWKDLINVSGVDQAGLMPLPMAGLGYIGGTGSTLGFIIGLLIFSKSKVHRDISKLSLVPGLFGINEPVNFGIPIVLTPIYFIPYVFAFVITYTTGHLWILIHWIRPAVVWTPTMPYGLNILFATDFDWWSLLVSVVQLAISFVLWLPFVFIGPKYQAKVEEAGRLKKEAAKKARLEKKAAEEAAKAEQIQATA